MRNRILVAALLACAALPAMAKDVDAQCPSGCTQGDFDAIANDLVATVDYKVNGPSEATGLTGFGIGAFATYTSVGNEWQTVTGSDFSGIGLAGLQASKGLPLGIDLGGYYASAPGTNVKAYGVQVRYAFLEGSAVTPAVALGFSYSKLTGVDDFDLDSKDIDLSVSKGFGPVTPFGGVGYVTGSADPSAAVETATGLKKSDVKETKLYAGLRLSLGLFEITPQITRIGDATSYSTRFGFSFGL